MDIVGKWRRVKHGGRRLVVSGKCVMTVLRLASFSKFKRLNFEPKLRPACADSPEDDIPEAPLKHPEN